MTEKTAGDNLLTKHYAEIWSKLSAIDVSHYVEKKNGLSYLSWAWAWGVLMEHYPHAEYSFPQAEVHPDGTVTVHCDIVIGLCHRAMWLPVMDYKNNAIKNPDARKISDTRMRCLVKCLAMFGLGHRIYAGEDINPPGEPEVVGITKETAPAPAPVAQKAEKKAPTKQGINDIPDEEAAKEVVSKTLEFANKFCSDTESLLAFWKENKKLIDMIDSNYPNQFAELKKGFTELKAKLGESK
ncbi:MAG: DUF1071 domain-containing protein [Burkholderiales bacterium]